MSRISSCTGPFSRARLRFSSSRLPALAHQARIGTLVIHHPWTWATPSGAAVAGGYTIIENTGRTADRLVGGGIGAAAGFALHDMAMKDEVMSMSLVEGGLEIPRRRQGGAEAGRPRTSCSPG